MDSRIKPIREASTSAEKKPSSPPQVRKRSVENTSTDKILLVPQITPNPNLLSSLFSSLQFNQTSIFNPMLDMGSTRALVLLVSAFDIKLPLSLTTITHCCPLGTSCTGSRNAEADERRGKAAKVAKQQFPIDIIANVKFQQLQSLPRPHKSPSTSSTLNSFTASTTCSYTASLQEPVIKRDSNRNLTTRSQLSQYTPACETNKIIANIDGNATTTTSNFTQCHHHQQSIDSFGL